MPPVGSAPARIDRYEILGELGHGGFGTVYRARHTILGTEVALKVLSAGHARESGMVERFLREAQAAAGIGNPHIVGVSDAGVTSDGMPFLAMELLEGTDLEQRMARSGRLSAAEVLGIARQLLEGLGAAHARGIVHRDLKPANVFLTRSARGEPFVKILDFGISKVVEPGRVAALTQTGAVLGTPAYMAPEQLADASSVDLRADLYAVGAILFEAISGRLPFKAESLSDLMQRAGGQPALRLDQVLTNAPPPLTELIDRALAADRSQRFQSASEMRDAILRVQSMLGPTPAGFASYSVAEMAPVPHLHPPGVPPTSGAPGSGPVASGPPPSGGHGGAPSYGATPPPSHGGPPSVRATPSGGSRALWIGLVAVGVLLPLACIGGGVGALMLSGDDAADDDGDVGEVLPTPPPPPPAPAPAPAPPGFPTPAPPPSIPPASAGPPVAAALPADAEPCAVPPIYAVECDRRFSEHDPPECALRRGRELFVVGAYEPATNDGRVIVDLARTVAPIELVLSSYGATDWVLRLADGVQLERVVLVGYSSESRVVEGLPDGVEAEARGRRGFPIMGWDWDGMSADWSGRATSEAAERHMSLSLRGYVGCYNPQRYFIGQAAP